MFQLWMQTGSWRPLLGTIFGVLLFATAVFLILLVLVQRGRGGGLAGAFGGMGGQSAFGAKAGDTFTKITIYASTFWILLCMAALVLLNPPVKKVNEGPPSASDPLSGSATTESGATETGATTGTTTGTTGEGAPPPKTGETGSPATTTGDETDAEKTNTGETGDKPSPPQSEPEKSTDAAPATAEHIRLTAQDGSPARRWIGRRRAPVARWQSLAQRVAGIAPRAVAW